MPAVDYINQKKNVASWMRTSDWDLVDAQIRERSFFMAAVQNARLLQMFRDAVRLVSEGHISQAEARRRLRLALQASGYRPAEGEEGSLDDLSSVRRMDVAIGTNKDLARGWYIRQALLQDPGHPALELYRKGSARAPRDWVSRWAEAAASVDNAGVAPGGQWIALVSSPIWKALSRFDQPYPPFDFGSHMWVKPVKYSTCVELGLIPPDGEDVGEPPLPDEKAAADRSRYRSPNEGVGADTSALDADIASALDDALGVVARRRGDILEMSDVNGTSPKTAEEIADELSRPDPSGATAGIRSALDRLAAGDVSSAADPRLDALVSRIAPKPLKNVTVEHDLDSEGELREFDSALAGAGYVAPCLIPASIGSAPSASRSGWKVVIKASTRSARDLRPIFSVLRPNGGNWKRGDIVVIEGTRLKIKSKSDSTLPGGCRCRTYIAEEEV